MTLFEKISILISTTNWREKLSMIAGSLMIVATAYFNFAEVWGLPFGPYIMETSTMIVAGIGAILGVRTCANILDKDDEDFIIEPTEKEGDINAEDKQ